MTRADPERTLRVFAGAENLPVRQLSQTSPVSDPSGCTRSSPSCVPARKSPLAVRKKKMIPGRFRLSLSRGSRVTITVPPPTPIAETCREPDPAFGIFTHRRDLLRREVPRRGRPNAAPVLKGHQAGTAAHPKPAGPVHAKVVDGLKPTVKRLEHLDLAAAELKQLPDFHSGPECFLPDPQTPM